MTKFIDITTAFEPKKEVKKTVFTHYKDSAGSWSNITNSTLGPESYANVVYLGQQNYDGIMYDLFKAWDSNFVTAVLLLGTKGDEAYQPFYQK